MFCFRCLKLKSPYNICSRGRPLWGLCQKFSRGIYKNQWAPNWNLQMKQQNFPSWLDWKIMEVGIMMKWKNKCQRRSSDFAVVRVPWEPSEQATVTEVKFTVLLRVGCCRCVVTVLPAEGPSFRPLTVSDVSFHGIILNLAASQSRAKLGFFMCLLPPVFWITFCGPGPKHAAFLVSKRMWCQLLGWGQCNDTSSDTSMCLKSKPEEKKSNVQGKHKPCPACDNTM